MVLQTFCKANRDIVTSEKSNNLPMLTKAKNTRAGFTPSAASFNGLFHALSKQRSKFKTLVKENSETEQVQSEALKINLP